MLNPWALSRFIPDRPNEERVNVMGHTVCIDVK